MKEIFSTFRVIGIIEVIDGILEMYHLINRGADFANIWVFMIVECSIFSVVAGILLMNRKAKSLSIILQSLRIPILQSPKFINPFYIGLTMPIEWEFPSYRIGINIGSIILLYFLLRKEKKIKEK